MKSLAEPPTPATYEPDFLLKLDERKTGLRRATLVSIALHLLVGAVSVNVQFGTAPPRLGPEITVRRVTPLVAPPIQPSITQKSPNTREVSKEFDLQSLAPRQEVKARPPVAALSPSPSPSLPAPSLPAAPQIEAEAPAMAQLLPQGPGVTNQPPPPPPVSSEKPKIAFENLPGTGRSKGNVSGGPIAPNVAIPMPKATVDEAMIQVTRKPGGGLVVGDEADALLAPGASLSQSAAPGRMGSALELLSDPQGADFRPYLIKVLSAVRRNWFAVIPESARMGRQGRVLIQFAISRDGHVPKLIIATPSGAEPLDRAAVAGISASNPFPPLPTEFRGDRILLQLSFVYNARR